MLARIQILVLFCILFCSCSDQNTSKYIVQGLVTSNIDGSPCVGFDIEFEQQIIEAGSFNGFYETAATTTTDAYGFYSLEFPRKSAIYFRINIEQDGWFPIVNEINPEDLTPDVVFDYDVITTPIADLEIKVMNTPPAYASDKLRVRLLKTFEEYSTCDAEWRVFNGATIDSTWACTTPGDIWMPYLFIDQTDPENEVNTIDSMFCESFETTTINVVY